MIWATGRVNAHKFITVGRQRVDWIHIDGYTDGDKKGDVLKSDQRNQRVRKKIHVHDTVARKSKDVLNAICLRLINP